MPAGRGVRRARTSCCHDHVHEDRGHEQRWLLPGDAATTSSGMRKSTESGEVPTALSLTKECGGRAAAYYARVELPDGDAACRRAQTEQAIPTDARALPLDNLTSQSGSRSPTSVTRPFETSSGTTYRAMHGRLEDERRTGWRGSVCRPAASPAGTTLRYVRYLDDFPAFPLTNLWTDTGDRGFADPTRSTSSRHDARSSSAASSMTTDPGDLVLDPTCGSGTTAYVAEQWGRRWITIDTSPCRARPRPHAPDGARYPYYLLADSPEGATQGGRADAARLPLPVRHGDDIRKGFVYKRVPHVTLKSIAQNPDIREGMTRDGDRRRHRPPRRHRDALRPALRGHASSSG